MANRKISDLTALTAPATGDLLPIVDISEAAAADKNKKITFGELLASAPAGSAAAPSFSFDGDPNTGIYSPGADTLAFVEGGVEAMRIDSSGRLLVGTTTVIQDETGAGFKAEQNSGGSSVVYIRNSSTNSADASPCLGLGKSMTTTSSSARFIQFFADNAATPMGGIVGNGASNVQFASISDIRDKENIQPVAGAFDKIKELEVVSYDWKQSKEHVKAGFIAQNVETVFPEYVVENMSSDGAEPRKGITGGLSSGYVAVLTAALQEAINKIETLEARLTAAGIE
jgi:hypothetical protein